MTEPVTKPVIIKICGLTEARSLDAALGAGADMVGFVFFPPSPRHLDAAIARVLAAQVGSRAQKVALSVDADDALLAASIEALRPDLLQLHGKESPDRVLQIKARFGLPVMKAIAVERADDLARIADYRGVADRILFDARAPKDATRPGGLGKSFDWHLLDHVEPTLDYMLSGGLTPDNVAEALAITHAPGIDVSSGVESQPGVKDSEKIVAFIRAARAADASMNMTKQAHHA